MTRRILLTLLVTGVAGAVAGTGTFSAFSGASADPANQFSSGTVAVGDSHAAATPITISNLRPGTTSSNCLAVTYSGSLDANLRQYATSTGSLAPYVNVKITRGSGLSGSFPSCAGFSADAANYNALGAGVLYDGSLTSLPSSWATAGLDPTSASPETWTTSESHAYRYDISLTNTAAAQGLAADVTLYWEARNL